MVGKRRGRAKFSLKGRFLKGAQVMRQLSISKDTLEMWRNQGMPFVNLQRDPAKKPMYRYPIRKIEFWLFHEASQPKPEEKKSYAYEALANLQLQQKEGFEK